MIDTQQGLAEVVSAVSRADWVALDTEADSLYAYPEKLCLIQCSLPDRDEIIDPLSGLELKPFLESVGLRECILHGADYDLRLLQRSVGFLPPRVFDTMIGAQLLGYEELSLERLAKRLLGLTLEKGPQRANWAKRPLTPKMIDYAHNDTRYLKPISDHLKEELKTRGRLDWHEESCRRLVEDCAQPREVEEGRYRRLKGASKLDASGLAVLRELWRWREKEALRVGSPPYFILAHESMVAVSAAAGNGEVTALLPKRFPAHRRRGLQAAVARGLVAKPESEVHPRSRRSPQLSRAQKGRFQELQTTRDRNAKELGIDPSLIASRATLVALASDWSKHEGRLMSWQRGLLNGSGR